MMQCRKNCGACCIAPSISTPMPDSLHGKAAGLFCVHLDVDLRCKLFGFPSRPKVCSKLQPHYSMCGNSHSEAMEILTNLELATLPIEIIE